MPSFEIIYEEDEDVLEVTFAEVDERFSRSLPLNENIIVHLDTMAASAWGITFYSFAQLLQVSETHLDGLAPLDDASRQRIFSILSQPPVAYFLGILEQEHLRALVKAPCLMELIGQ